MDGSIATGTVCAFPYNMRMPGSSVGPVLFAAIVGLAACGDTGNAAGGGDGGDPGSDPGTTDAGGSSSGDGGKRSDAGAPEGGDGFDASPIPPDAGPASDRIQTVFLIMMENHSWSTISTDEHAVYLNGTLVPMGGHAENYSTPPGNHPSEPNYIWLEAGGNVGITTDDDPATNHKGVTDHLVTQLDAAGVSWKAYAEDVSGNDCPLTSSGKYAAKHTPQLFFDDVTNSNDANSAGCKAHVRPYTELAADLSANKVARYNFITPNLCNDMHGLTLGCGTQNFNEIGAGDAWLKSEVPKILASAAYKNNGLLIILWDEGDESLLGKASDGPIPLLVLSPKAKVGYKSSTKLTHSSTLRTVQEIFGVGPFLRDAANATDLSEFFTSFP